MTDETEVSAETALGKFRVAGKDVSTLATIANLILVVLLLLLMWQHIGHADSYSRTLQDMVQAMREQNCLIAIPEAQREAKADFCKRITK
jgi:hypothetical protein